MWLIDAVTSLTASASPTTSASPITTVSVPPPDPWMSGFWACFWIYSAVVVVAVVMYQIGYHRWNPFKKKSQASVWDNLPPELSYDDRRKPIDGSGKS